ncbi:hypothetical protein EYZ11_000171 [Aspergillus tanneri]|uniref:N-acetyltransferase domain-containing protein n=1 Tax=Aspergillus tanneri TaxID=1220188 RepID=A0A4S3JXT4_9EURO|nr:uncharacterized protein ATNIH1004_006464 [Aspergillus tanneri]KAA8647763.1 hypothetical protein ATNIH1004_006464 [Aspergillus tanneri]THD00278.1 hypothetical protein EYZ11_000171 [Aspergillus tanneri]
MRGTRTDQGLLQLEVDAIFGLDSTSSQPVLKDPKYRAIYAWSLSAKFLALSPEIPFGPSQCHSCIDQAYEPGTVPEALVHLSETFPGTIEGGPCFTFPDRQLTPPSITLPIYVSDSAGKAAAREFIRPSNWEPDEWAELITGSKGEWAMAVHEKSPVSICFSPAMNSTVAEAGIWTHPDFRGRRIAPAVVAAWSECERRNKEILFYSIAGNNLSSQSVARTLGLDPLGWIWKLHKPAPDQESSGAIGLS